MTVFCQLDAENRCVAWFSLPQPDRELIELPKPPTIGAVWSGSEWVIAADARTTKRSALQAQWDGLPAWIRGPYRAAFEAANAMLDEGDDEAAEALIAYQSALAGYNAEQVATFDQVKKAFANGIADLSEITT